MGDKCAGTGGWRCGLEAAGDGGESAMAMISRVPTGCPVCRRRGSGRWLWIATQTSDPLVRAGTPETNVGRPSSGQKYTSSLGHGLWQRTRRPVSSGMSTACNNRARLGGVEMDGLRIRLCRHGSTVGDINGERSEAA